MSAETFAPVGIETSHGIRLLAAPLGFIRSELFRLDSGEATCHAIGENVADALDELGRAACENIAMVMVYTDGQPYSIASAWLS